MALNSLKYTAHSHTRTPTRTHSCTHMLTHILTLRSTVPNTHFFLMCAGEPPQIHLHVFTLEYLRYTCKCNLSVYKCFSVTLRIMLYVGLCVSVHIINAWMCMCIGRCLFWIAFVSLTPTSWLQASSSLALFIHHLCFFVFFIFYILPAALWPVWHWRLLYRLIRAWCVSVAVSRTLRSHFRVFIGWIKMHL